MMMFLRLRSIPSVSGFALRAFMGFACLSALAAPSAIAQGVRGRAVTALDSAPLIGAIVQARKSDGTVAGSTLTSETGAFAIPDLPTGQYALRVLRIGYRPFEAGNFSVNSGATSALNFAWTGDPIPLTTQVVNAGRTAASPRTLDG